MAMEQTGATKATNPTDWELSEAMLDDWLRRARESQHTHYEAARYCVRLNSVFSIPVVLLTTAMGTSAFASIQKSVSDGWKIAFGILSILAAVFAAIQAHLKLVERSERHRRVAAGYGSVRREIEEALVLPVHERRHPAGLLDGIRGSLDHLAQESPDIPTKIWNIALKVDERDRKISRAIVTWRQQGKSLEPRDSGNRE